MIDNGTMLRNVSKQQEFSFIEMICTRIQVTMFLVLSFAVPKIAVVLKIAAVSGRLFYP